MTADEFNVLLAQLGWSISFLAYSKLGMTSDRAVRRWRSGQNRIPPRTRRLAPAGRPGGGGPTTTEGMEVTTG
jgi:hypothetical protein